MRERHKGGEDGTDKGCSSENILKISCTSMQDDVIDHAVFVLGLVKAERTAEVFPMGGF